MYTLMNVVRSGLNTHDMYVAVMTRSVRDSGASNAEPRLSRLLRTRLCSVSSSMTSPIMEYAVVVIVEHSAVSSVLVVTVGVVRCGDRCRRWDLFALDTFTATFALFTEGIVVVDREEG